MAQPVRLPPTEAFERWAASYDSENNAILALEDRCLQPSLAHIADRLILDVACGTARRLPRLLSAGAHPIGLDLTRAMLAQATSKPGVTGRCVQADSLRLPILAGAVDLLLGSFLTAYVTELDALLAELARVVRPGGRILLSELHPDAARAGWRRTFRVAGQLYEPEHIAHSIESIEAAGRCSNLLDMVSITAHSFGEPERHIFEQAGKTNFNELKDQPAVWIGIWQRSARP